MEALILAALLNLPVSAECQQWLDRVNDESNAAARMTWGPQKERHIKRMNKAAEKVTANCYMDPNDEGQVADAKSFTSTGIVGGGF